MRYSASSYPEGKTSFGYDAYNRLTQIKDDVYTAGSTFTTKSQFDYEYDLASNLVKEKYAKVGGGLGDRFAYDGYHRLTEAWMGVLDATVMASSSNPSGWVSGQVHSYLTYDLDDANNRTETKVQDAGGTATTDYDLQGGSHPQGPSNRYDAVGPSGGALTPYEYDGRGNLIRDGVFVFRYDYLNRLQEVWKIRVDGDDDTEQYALVQEGADEEARQEVKLEVPDLMQRLPREHMNPTFRARLRAQITGGVIRLRGTGQGGGGMPSFTTPAQADLHAVYAYDAYNRRIMGIVVGVDTQFHTWDGWRQVVQYSLDTVPSPDAAVPTKQFVWGSQLDELLSYRRKNGSTWENYFVLHGGQDTAAKLVNSSGAVVEQYEYDPYGKVSVYVGSSTTAVATSSVGLPFLWKGVRLDSETGLLQMRNRYYSAALGRFLTRDPLGTWGDPANYGSSYSYGGASPLCRNDPLGLMSFRVDLATCTITLVLSLQAHFSGFPTHAAEAAWLANAERQIERVWNANAVSIVPTSATWKRTTVWPQGTGAPPCVSEQDLPCACAGGFRMRVDVVMYHGGWMISEDIEAGVVNHPRRSGVGGGDAWLDVEDVDVHGRGLFSQMPIAHEFGHMIGLSHPSAGLPGIVPNSAREYNDPSTGLPSPNIMGYGNTVDASNAGPWVSYINSTFPGAGYVAR